MSPQGCQTLFVQFPSACSDIPKSWYFCQNSKLKSLWVFHTTVSVLSSKYAGAAITHQTQGLSGGTACPWHYLVPEAQRSLCSGQLSVTSPARASSDLQAFSDYLCTSDCVGVCMSHTHKELHNLFKNKKTKQKITKSNEEIHSCIKGD